jgi:hypothetical protein
MQREKTQFYFPRTPLLIEIDRRCAYDDCRKRDQISLTKMEAIDYRGFNCLQCERWNDDRLNQSELPESWTEANASH